MTELLELLKFLALFALFGTLVTCPRWIARRRQARKTS